MGRGTFNPNVTSSDDAIVSYNSMKLQENVYHKMSKPTRNFELTAYRRIGATHLSFGLRLNISSIHVHGSL